MKYETVAAAPCSIVVSQRRNVPTALSGSREQSESVPAVHQRSAVQETDLNGSAHPHAAPAVVALRLPVLIVSLGAGARHRTHAGAGRLPAEWADLTVWYEGAWLGRSPGGSWRDPAAELTAWRQGQLPVARAATKKLQGTLFEHGFE